MSSQTQGPKWWQVYVGLPLLVGLFWPEMSLSLTETGHIVAQLGILFLIFGFMQVWIRANRSALMGLDAEEGKGQFKICQIPPAGLRMIDDIEARRSESPLLQIPAAGLKGVLSDTFEWDAPEEGSGVFADHGAVSRKE